MVAFVFVVFVFAFAVIFFALALVLLVVSLLIFFFALVFFFLQPAFCRFHPAQAKLLQQLPEQYQLDFQLYLLPCLPLFPLAWPGCVVSFPRAERLNH